MEFQKYKKSLILFVICAGILSILPIAQLIKPTDKISPALPGDGWGLEIFLLFIVMIPLFTIIGGLVGGYLIAPLFLFIHKKFLGRKME